MKPIAVKINKGTPEERMIGTLYPDEKMFVKVIYGSKHIFRVLDAIGIDAKYFTNVLLPQGYTIKVVDREDNRVYLTPAQMVKDKGEYYHFNKKQDDKAQIFLPRRYWSAPKPLTEEEKWKKFSQECL